MLFFFLHDPISNAWGFQPSSSVNENGLRDIYIQDVNRPPVYSEDYLIGKRTGAAFGIDAFPQVFETAGVEILNGIDFQRDSILILDEIGVLEERAYLFQSLVFQCLDGSLPVLGSLKKKDGIFIQRIKTRRDVTILEVTRENREEIYADMLKRLKIDTHDRINYVRHS